MELIILTQNTVDFTIIPIIVNRQNKFKLINLNFQCEVINYLLNDTTCLTILEKGVL